MTLTLEPRSLADPAEPNDAAPAEVADLLTEAKIGPRDGTGRVAVVAMSGGVDSAVAALVMRERGYRVVGMNLRLFSPDDPEHQINPCCGIAALDDARATCALLGVPFYAIDMEAEFGAAVVDRFVGEYAAGRTPNPCLECNRHVKFRHLVRRAKLLGAHCLATGHYARIVHGDEATGEPHRLYRAVDPRKDQSYVLYTMDQAQLGYVRFPLGNLTKAETRRLARAFGLPVAEKAESQEICFVGGAGKGAYAEFVAARRPDVARPGEIVDTAGAVVGRHRGLVHHTVGQRRGLGIAAGAPLYVVGLDPAANRVVVGPRTAAAARVLIAEDVTLTSGDWPAESFAVEAVVRYRGTPHPAEVRLGPGGSGEATVTFSGEGPVAAPGQAVVFYRGDEVLGGGTIREVVRGAGGEAGGGEDGMETATGEVQPFEEGGGSRWKLWAILGGLGTLIVLALIIWGLYSLGDDDQSALERLRDIAVIFIVLLSMLIVIFLAAITAALIFLTFQIKDRVIPLLEELTGTARRLRGTAAFVSEEAVKPIVSIAGTYARVRAMTKTVVGKDGRKRR